MFFTSLLAWFSPVRWLMLGGVILGLVFMQAGFYLWAHGKGVNQERVAQAKAEAIQIKKISSIETERNAQQKIAVQLGSELKEKQEKLNATDYERSKALLAARDAKRKLADGLRSKGSPVDPGLPSVGTVTDDRTDLLAIAGNAIGTANKNADIANAAFSALEKDCIAYQKTWNKDTKICTYGNASERYASRVNEVNEKAAALTQERLARSARLRATLNKIEKESDE